MESIESLNGLINPILISPDKKLLASYRRLRAIRDELQWPKIESVVSHAKTPARPRRPGGRWPPKGF